MKCRGCEDESVEHGLCLLCMATTLERHGYVITRRAVRDLAPVCGWNGGGCAERAVSLETIFGAFEVWLCRKHKEMADANPEKYKRSPI